MLLPVRPLTSLVLRDYQEECIRTCLRAYEEGIRRQAVSLPVGSGKTMIFSALIERLSPPSPSATKALVLAHREELLDQAARMIERVSPGARVSIEQGRSRADPLADVIVASVPTLGRRDSRRLEQFSPGQFKAIIIDEAHHAPAASYRRILEHFGLHSVNLKGPPIGKDDNGMLLWGCSATLLRNDHLGLGDIFDRIVYHVDMQRLIAEGWLCRPLAISIHTDIDLDRVAERGGDFDPEELSLAIDTPARNRLVAETWRETAVDKHGRQSTIVFCLNVRHVEHLASEFAALNVRTAAITGSTPEAARQEILDLFSSGKINVLLNCAVLTEGTDLPRADCVLLTRPTCNPSLYVQMVGRGLRRHPDKEYCLILDVVDRFRSPRRTLAVFPTLFPAKQDHQSTGVEGTESEGGDSSGLHPKRHFDDALIGRIKVSLQRCNLSESFFSLGAHRIAWLPIARDLLLAADRDLLVVLCIDPVDEPGLMGSASLTITGSIRVARHSGETTGGTSGEEIWCPPGTFLHEALELLVARLQREAPTVLQRLSRDAYWRQHPISPGQLQYIRGIGRRLSAPSEAIFSAIDWNVGHASDAISKYRFMLSRQLPLSWEDIFAASARPIALARARSLKS